ncbi:hypothetical protein B0H11DRAFT_2006988 [Mycena galericulata]|nr:hypothetical protein B0H11DRAFT_2006988 [Mycena galericulata]
MHFRWDRGILRSSGADALSYIHCDASLLSHCDEIRHNSHPHAGPSLTTEVQAILFTYICALQPPLYRMDAFLDQNLARNLFDELRALIIHWIPVHFGPQSLCIAAPAVLPVFPHLSSNPRVWRSKPHLVDIFLSAVENVTIGVFEIPPEICDNLLRPFAPTADLVLRAMEKSVASYRAVGLISRIRVHPVQDGPDVLYYPIEHFYLIILPEFVPLRLEHVAARFLQQCVLCGELLPHPGPRLCPNHVFINVG